MPSRLVIDTDIGTDVDDLWTLAMVPGLPGVRLEAVTIVYGDTERRARMAASGGESTARRVPRSPAMATPAPPARSPATGTTQLNS